MADAIRDAVGKECPSRTGLARVGGNGQMAGWRVSGRRPPSGWEWKGSQSGQGATELVFPGPALGKMQSEAARRAGEPSGEGEEASSQGLGGYQLLTQTDARGPAGHHLHRQPGPLAAKLSRVNYICRSHCLNKTVTQRDWLPQIKCYPKSGRQSRGRRHQQDGKTGIAGDDPRPLPSFIQEGQGVVSRQ